LLKGSEAYLISAEGKGVKTIAKMLTVTRIYNSSSAVGGMRKMIGLLRDYSSRRIIGKKRLADLPLQKRILSHL
jgi:alkylation response protein AidB-like acyl-CoA dehydrogenase